MKLKLISLCKIFPNPKQPRKSLRKIEMLADSIKRIGLIQPITVERQENGKYLIVSGERRYWACKRLKWKTIPAIIDSNSSPYKMLAENIARDDLCLIEKICGSTEILEKEFGKDWKTILGRVHSNYNIGVKERKMESACKSIGMAPGTIYLGLSVLELPTNVKKMILKNLDYFTDGVILKLSRLRDEKKQIQITHTIVEKEFNTAQSMRYIARNSLPNTDRDKYWVSFFELWRKEFSYLKGKFNQILDENRQLPDWTDKNFLTQLKDLNCLSLRVLEHLKKFQKEE